MWSPNVDKPLVRILCHTHPIRSIAIDSKGLYVYIFCFSNVVIFVFTFIKILTDFRLMNNYLTSC